MDEIRQGLWFFEQSFWDAIPELERALGGRLAGRGQALRFGTWIGGDLDGNPNVGPETVADALERARQLAATCTVRSCASSGRRGGCRRP